MPQYYNKYLLPILILLGLLLFVPLLGAVHLFDWDEINFGESAREMLITQDFFRVQINYDLFWEKPPLFFWLQSISMYCFGVNDFASRLPNAIVGVATFVAFYFIGKKHYDKIFVGIWTLVYAGSFLPHLYFKSGIIDPIFNLFIFLGLYHIAMFSKNKNEGDTKLRINHTCLAGLFIGLAILTKGPVALLIAILCTLVYVISEKSIKPFSIRTIFAFAAICGSVCFLWFGLQVLKDGPWFLITFIQYQIRLFSTQDAGHGGPFIYHWVVLLIGCFPGSIFIFKSLRKNYDDNPAQKTLKFWMIISFFVVLVLFSIVKTKIIHYSSFCYLPLSFLATDYLYRLFHNKKTFPLFQKVLIGVIGGIIGFAIAIVPFVGKNITKIPTYIKIDDAFAIENLKAEVTWTGWESLIGIFYLIAIILILLQNKKDAFVSMIYLFFSTLIVIQLTLYIIVPKIERYSQGAAIDFFISKQNEDCYVNTIDYKSYAHLFYAQIKPDQNPIYGKASLNASDTLLCRCKSIENVEQRNNCVREWMVRGPVDKTTYLVTKIDRGAWLKDNRNLNKIGEKNGFVFYKREKVQ